ncbi:MAG TPA: hypothetical protein VH275_09980 [Solirubrobacterales bacterium]|nr:hypothetical protein [Solirubrobacterales bacterium]
MRTIKTLGIAAAVALALIAVAGAGAASANNFKADYNGEVWSGSLTGKSHNLWLRENISCSNVSFSGETTAKTSSQVTVTPTLGCSYFGFPMGWATNGCKYRFHPGAGPALVGTMDIVGCESPMTFIEPNTNCRMEIGNQSGLGTVTYKNVAGSPSTITAVANLTGLTYTRFSCVNGANGTFSDGTYTGEWTIKGSAFGGVPAGLSVESTSAAPFTKFAAEEAPATIAGTNTNGNTKAINFGTNGYLLCKKDSYSGTLSATTSGSITVAPTIQSCTWNANAEEKEISLADEYVTTGACSFMLKASGGFEIVGTSCASKPITVALPGCLLTVGPQSVASPQLGYSNEGTGKLRSVKIAPIGSSVALKYTATGASCPEQGTFANGYFSGKATFTATNSKGASQGISLE